MYTVAVVDDEKNIRSLVSMALIEEGFKAVEFSDGAAAWTAFQEQMPDVIYSRYNDAPDERV